MSIRFENRVAIVTGAGAGLGRSHALGLASRGAKVVVNDLARADGSNDAADAVVAEIKAAGGEAIANGANVANYDEVEAMVKATMDAWGRVDILVNNAGILRDKSFAKMSLEDFQIVINVHLNGSYNCSKAVWDIMRGQNYGRIVMTTSSSGLYGNFGQTNYGAAKMALVGLMNTLVIEGAKYGIQVNSLAPTAGTAMLEGLIDAETFDLMTTESVTAALLVLCAEEAPNRLILLPIPSSNSADISASNLSCCVMVVWFFIKSWPVSAEMKKIKNPAVTQLVTNFITTNTSRFKMDIISCS